MIGLELVLVTNITMNMEENAVLLTVSVRLLVCLTLAYHFDGTLVFVMIPCVCYQYLCDWYVLLKCMITTPVCVMTTPVCVMTAPACVMTTPVCVITTPVCVMTTPVCVMTTPACVMTAPACVMTTPIYVIIQCNTRKLDGS